ncbi:MAG: ribbon-helix-helix domain-containing protein [Fimbriimonadaceae bacterium]|nr:ribbon-helix-helix domain-containing protein [Alphaproteobacteria bacterium]
MALEDEFWAALREIAALQSVSLNGLVTQIDAGRAGSNLSSAIRIYVLNHYRQRAAKT